MPAEIGALSALGSALPSPLDVFNNISSMATNYMNQQYNRAMYERQRDDAIAFWHMQNAYNSPREQMKRFQEAGLNPHLIYGQGNSGNASPIPTPDTLPLNIREPRFEGSGRMVGEALLNMADLRIKNAQADNLEVQNSVIQQDAILRRWQAERAGFDLNLERRLEDVSFDARTENLRKTRVEIDLMINEDARQAAMNASNINEATQRMLTMIEQRKGMPLERGVKRMEIERGRQNIELMKKEGYLKDLEIRLREQGINPTDPMWARYVGMFLADMYEGRVTPSTIGESLWNWIIR